MTAKAERLTPPYVSWKTVQNYVEYLHKSKVPPHRIDTSMMPSTMSGQVRSALRVALRFLGLIDDDGIVSPAFVTLIETFDTPSWSKTLAQVVEQAYAPIVTGLDIQNGTAQMLNEKFREAGGVDGEVRFKAVRFYLSALDAAGVKFSPHFVARGQKEYGRVGPRKSRRPNGRTDQIDGGAGIGSVVDEALPESVPPTGMTRWPIPIPGKTGAVIIVPTDINEDDWMMIDTVVRAYIARAAKMAQV